MDVGKGVVGENHRRLACNARDTLPVLGVKRQRRKQLL